MFDRRSFKGTFKDRLASFAKDMRDKRGNNSRMISSCLRTPAQFLHQGFTTGSASRRC